MTGIFKSVSAADRVSMKLFALLSVLVLLGGGISCEQLLDRYQVAVGEGVNVILNLANGGDSPLQVSVIPRLPSGLSAAQSLAWAGSIPAGESQQVSYGAIAVSPGSYEVATLVEYGDESGMHQLLMTSDALTVY